MSTWSSVNVISGLKSEIRRVITEHIGISREHTLPPRPSRHYPLTRRPNQNQHRENLQQRAEQGSQHLSGHHLAIPQKTRMPGWEYLPAAGRSFLYRKTRGSRRQGKGSTFVSLAALKRRIKYATASSYGRAGGLISPQLRTNDVINFQPTAFFPPPFPDFYAQEMQTNRVILTPALSPLDLTDICKRYLSARFRSELGRRSAQSIGGDMAPLPEPPSFIPIPLILELDCISKILADAFRNPSE